MKTEWPQIVVFLLLLLGLIKSAVKLTLEYKNGRINKGGLYGGLLGGITGTIIDFWVLYCGGFWSYM